MRLFRIEAIGTKESPTQIRIGIFSKNKKMLGNFVIPKKMFPPDQVPNLGDRIIIKKEE